VTVELVTSGNSPLSPLGEALKQTFDNLNQQPQTGHGATSGDDSPS